MTLMCGKLVLKPISKNDQFAEIISVVSDCWRGVVHEDYEEVQGPAVVTRAAVNAQCQGSHRHPPGVGILQLFYHENMK